MISLFPSTVLFSMNGSRVFPDQSEIQGRPQGSYTHSVRPVIWSSKQLSKLYTFIASVTTPVLFPISPKSLFRLQQRQLSLTEEPFPNPQPRGGANAVCFSAQNLTSSLMTVCSYTLDFVIIWLLFVFLDRRDCVTLCHRVLSILELYLRQKSHLHIVV